MKRKPKTYWNWNTNNQVEKSADSSQMFWMPSSGIIITSKLYKFVWLQFPYRKDKDNNSIDSIIARRIKEFRHLQAYEHIGNATVMLVLFIIKFGIIPMKIPKIYVLFIVLFFLWTTSSFIQ